MFSQPDTLRRDPPSTLSQKADSTHTEYPTFSKDIPDQKLPHIPPVEVGRRDGKEQSNLCKTASRMCPLVRSDQKLTGVVQAGLVIDEIVYDCTSFVDKHPGGDAVIKSFAGKDCSCELEITFLPYLLLIGGYRAIPSDSQSAENSKLASEFESW
ncbi:hypothetical protein PV11_05461 [Exophiala sideris]|uniref:Cytochrome b5 heme-binding domain-containing protein n=1 Tax=Exophiala sideris TaxID=1016849 RepID=A0A0D1YQ61_9EURO|nr:hypothetical protein PV11_05461 [Exophiala sideris]